MATRPELDELRRDPAHTAILTDFDGTLALIVDDPAAARPVDGAPDVLDELADRYAIVAVLSGRPVDFIAPLVPRGVVIAGLYGLEVVRDGARHDHPDSERWRAEVARVADAAQNDGPAGMRVESKGVSLTLHYREHPDIADAVIAWAEAAAARAGLETRAARMSVELHPPVAVDKGTALLSLARGLRAACFFGDDRGDLRAFDALDELANEGAHCVRVAVRSDEAPPELLARADIVVDGPVGVVALLRELLDERVALGPRL